MPKIFYVKQHFQFHAESGRFEKNLATPVGRVLVKFYNVFETLFSVCASVSLCT